jgi:hypothetical protein
VPWLCAVAGLNAGETVATTIWRLDDVARVDGRATEVIGAPRVVDGAAVFDGKQDGIFVPEIPIAGAKQFTIDVCFNPAEGGGEAPRFLHLEDTKTWRALIEIRPHGRGGWWLDTHARMGDSDRGLTLIDPQRVHPTNQWHWVALRYDGVTMMHFVNGVKELEGDVKFGPLADGKVSLGVRQNKVYWFKGAIREVRFTRAAIESERLQRMK